MATQREHGITWCNETWNPLRGCTKVSEGCRNCYAMHVAARFSGPGEPYDGLAVRTPGGGARWTNQVRLVPEKLADPLRWSRPRLVFVNSMSDLFHPAVPDEFIAAVFGIMAVSTRHIFQVLTKRPERARSWFASSGSLGASLIHARRLLDQVVANSADAQHVQNVHAFGDAATQMAARYAGQPLWPLPNVWLGTSVEDQAAADDRIPELLATPATVRWISAEPMLGAIDLTRVETIQHRTHWDRTTADGRHVVDALRPMFHDGNTLAGQGPHQRPGLDWVVAGGESQAGARPIAIAAVRALRDQCDLAGVPFHFKQWGEWIPAEEWPGGLARAPQVEVQADVDGNHWLRVGKRRAGRIVEGTTHDAMPRACPPGLVASPVSAAAEDA